VQIHAGLKLKYRCITIQHIKMNILWQKCKTQA
jgi:hypothetical protein